MCQLQSFLQMPQSRNIYHPVIFENIDGSLILSTAPRDHWYCRSLWSGCSRMETSLYIFTVPLRNYAQPWPKWVDGSVAPTWALGFSVHLWPPGFWHWINALGFGEIEAGEVAQCINGRSILATISDDIQESTGSEQVCVGQQAGCEVAVHTIRDILQCLATRAFS